MMCKMSYDKLLRLEKKLALKLTLNIWILETSMPKYFEAVNDPFLYNLSISFLYFIFYFFC